MASTTTYTVTGMSCENCVRHVTEAAEELDGVQSAVVDLAAGTLTITGDVETAALREAIDDAGYELA